MTLIPFVRSRLQTLRGRPAIAESDLRSPGQGRGGETAPLPPKPANARYQSLDAWRGLACMMLLLFHATFYADFHFRITQPETWSLAGLPLNLLRKCWMGVPIFFVISGYCIAASIDSLRRKDHSLWDYCVRRFRRIYPPLWITYTLTVLFVFGVSLVPVIKENCPQLPKLSDMSMWSWIGNFAVVESWRHNLVGGEPQYLLNNTWTLCYEEQFYLVAGLLLALASRRFFLAVGLVTGASIVVRQLLRTFGTCPEGIFWDGHWVMFAGGILVYHMLNYQTARQRWWGYALLAAGVFYGAADRLFSSDPVVRHLGEYMAVAATFAIFLVVARPWDAAFSGSRLARPLQWCGKRSYSIYLTHYPLVVVVSSLLAVAGLTSELAVATVVVPLCTLLSLPVAVLFYEHVEKRFLNTP